MKSLIMSLLDKLLTFKISFLDQNNQRGSIKRVIFAEDRVGRGPGPRRNSEGSPHFMTCAGSPRFNSIDPMKRFPLRSEEEESMEEEEEEMEDTASNLFDFEDVEDLDDVVDYRPRGEVMNRIEDPQKRERRANEKYPGRISHEFLQNEETSFLTLDSLDEEADSDESGYVEAPPKSLLGQDDKKEEEESERSRLEPFMNKREDQSGSVTTYRTDGSENQRTKHEDSNIDKQEERKMEKKDPLMAVNSNQRIKEKERERVDFKYPISETIRKLASASLRSSKSFEMTSNNCLNVLNNFKTSKSFDSVKNDEIAVDSPSLHQRKQLLAQRGVMV